MHCNLRPPEPRRPFPALIRRHAKFEVAEPIHCRIYSVFAADTLLYAVTLTFDL